MDSNFLIGLFFFFVSTSVVSFLLALCLWYKKETTDHYKAKIVYSVLNRIFVGYPIIGMIILMIVIAYRSLQVVLAGL